MTIMDCPQHPSAALRLDRGVICVACGRRVVETPFGLVTREPDDALLAELRYEWKSNLGVAAFVIEETARARGMLDEGDAA